MKTLGLAFGSLLALSVGAASVQFTILPSGEAGVTGFRLRVGTNANIVNQWSEAIATLDFGANTNGVWTNAPAGQEFYAFATDYDADGLESLPSNLIHFRIRPGPTLQKPHTVSVLAWLESAEQANGPWTMLALLGESMTPIEDSQEFFRVKAEIAKGP